MDALLIAGLVTVLLFFFLGRPKPDVDGEQARALIDEEDATLVDVRSPDEFAAGHIDGAVNIPVDTLEQRLEQLGDRGSPVVVYCQSGMRSGRAKKVLEAAGFERAHDLGSRRRW